MGTTSSRLRKLQAPRSGAIVSYLILLLVLSCTCSAAGFTPINKPYPPPANSPSPGEGPAGSPPPGPPMIFNDLFDVATGNDVGSCQNHLSEIALWFEEVQEIVAKTVQNALKAFAAVSVNADSTAPAFPADEDRFDIIKGVYKDMQKFFAGGKLEEWGRPGLFCNDDWLIETDAIYTLKNGKEEKSEGFRDLMKGEDTFDNPKDKAYWSEKYINYRIGEPVCDEHTLAQTFDRSMRSIVFYPLLIKEDRPLKIAKETYLVNKTLTSATPMSFTLLHELDHLMRDTSRDLPYWGPRTDLPPDLPPDQKVWPGPPDRFIDHSPLKAIGVMPSLCLAQSKPNLVIDNAENVAYVGLTIFLSQFGSDFSTGQAWGIGANFEGLGPAFTDPYFTGWRPPVPKKPEKPKKGGPKNPPRSLTDRQGKIDRRSSHRAPITVVLPNSSHRGATVGVPFKA